MRVAALLVRYFPGIAPLLIALSMGMVAPASAETITIGGSTTVQKYMQLAEKAYAAKHPDINFSLNGGGSTAGFAQIRDQRVHIGMMSREMTAREAGELAHLKSDRIIQIAIALDAVVPVVSDEIYGSGIHSIQLPTLAHIYQGSVRNWKDIGGPNRQVIVIDKNIYHGTREVFADYVLGGNAAPLESVSVILDSDNDVLRLIRGSDQAIGYVGIGYVDASVHALDLEIDGKTVRATDANIRSGKYPMSRKLYVLLPKDAPDFVQAFVDFILSAEGQSLVKQAGFLPIK